MTSNVKLQNYMLAYYKYILITSQPFGDPDVIRTRGLRIRNPMLYPTELRGRIYYLTPLIGTIAIVNHN